MDNKCQVGSAGSDLRAAYAVRIRPGCSIVKAAAKRLGQQDVALLYMCTKVYYIKYLQRIIIE